ncbi:Competence protein ComM [Citrobacter koseri]|uniref:Competence protein ComM n=1 Tax=Citrobacter koseri TaxID=545 RepID=A0A2X2WBQ4_CITKO|nr:Competence protein ComM [Citrobacter koseri]
MSLSIVHTRAALGVNAPPITIEVHISNGLPGLTMVGLPETTVKEARDRVRSAIINSGYEFPAKKITINLAPADLPKEGGRYDLPIAIALLAASEQLTTNKLNEYELVGELPLQVRYVAFQARYPVQPRRFGQADISLLQKRMQQKLG